MNASFRFFNFLLLPVTALAFTSCGYVHRVPPGQSVAFALAKKPEMVNLPPAATPNPANAASAQPGATNSAATGVHVEPPLPSSDVEKIADSFTLGNLCMEQGRYEDAIAAYQEAVKLNPGFADAWNKLAVAYQNIGQDKKALEAYRKSKALAAQ